MRGRPPHTYFLPCPLLSALPPLSPLPSPSPLQLCHKDGYVIFRNSELLAGNLAKKTLGDGTKKSLFYVLQKDHGHMEAAR